jgi:hypothetical protein
MYEMKNWSAKKDSTLVPLLKALRPDLPISIECVNEKLSITMSPVDRVRMYLEDVKPLLKIVEEM